MRIVMMVCCKNRFRYSFRCQGWWFVQPAGKFIYSKQHRSSQCKSNTNIHNIPMFSIIFRYSSRIFLAEQPDNSITHGWTMWPIEIRNFRKYMIKINCKKIRGNKTLLEFKCIKRLPKTLNLYFIVHLI